MSESGVRLANCTVEDGVLYVIDDGENIGRSDIDIQTSSGEVGLTSAGELDGGVGITSGVNSSDAAARGDTSMGNGESDDLVAKSDQESELSDDARVLTKSTA